MRYTASLSQGSSLLIGDSNSINGTRLFSNSVRIMQLTRQVATLDLEEAEDESVLNLCAVDISPVLPQS